MYFLSSSFFMYIYLAQKTVYHEMLQELNILHLVPAIKFFVMSGYICDCTISSLATTVYGKICLIRPSHPFPNAP